jgi:hypothetical protein
MIGYLLAAVVATGICVGLGRYRLAAVKRNWETTLCPEAQRQLSLLRLSARAERAIAEDTIELAAEARGEKDWAEACRMVDLLAASFTKAMPDRLRNLRAMALCVRVGAMVMPPPPVTLMRFRLGRVRGAVGVGTLLHHVLVTPAERMLLRLWLLSVAFRLALRVLHQASVALHAYPPSAHYWQRCVDGQADWLTADDEHVASFELVLRSAAAKPRLTPVER